MQESKSFILYILLTPNNIFYTITDLKGNVKIWTSLGTKKIKGTKKITLNSIKLNLLNLFSNINIKKINIHIIFKGLNKYKKFILKYLKQLSLNIVSICDYTTNAHNGCKIKKIRRL